MGWLFGCLFMFTFGGCTLPESDPAQAQDGAPAYALAAHEVIDAVPRPDPVLLAGNISPYTVDGVEYQVLESAAGYSEQGIASWYGTKFHGRKTSNGEDYDLFRPTAAHRTLPIPSYVRVTHLGNGRSIVVRVNDRGPFHSERIIDLSYAAAVKLGFAEQGTAPVRVEAIEVAGVDDRRGKPQGEYRYLQLGAFANASAAQRLRQEVSALVALPVFITPVDVGGNRLNRVRVGPASNGEELERLRQLLLARGYSPGQPLP
jgi:rare lipoprotein A